MTDEPSKAVVQRLAAYELERTAESRRTLIEEHSAAFRWLLASLLAVNGGAMVFSKELFAAGDLLPLIAGGLYLVGIMAALLTGWFSQRANRGLLEPLGETTAFWLKGVETGELDVEEYETLTEKIQVAIKSAKPTQVCGWISASSFFIASLLIGTYFAL